MVVKQTTPSKESTSPWESKTVGANWKMHTLDTKPTNEGDKGHEEVKVREEVAWNKQESYETDSVAHKEPEASISSELDTIKAPSSGAVTPTLEGSGRTSVNSVSSLSDVSGTGGGAKKGGGGVSRSTSPRKMNRWVWLVFVALCLSY